jgi:hypothetical protein
MLSERSENRIGSIGREGSQQGPRSERRQRIGSQRGAKFPSGLEPQHGAEIGPDSNARGHSHLVEAGEHSSFRRVVERGRPELGGKEGRLDDRDPRVVKGVQRRFHHRRIQPDQAVGRLVGQDGGALDRREPNLDEGIPRSDSAGRNEPSILRESKELADDERLCDRLGHLGMATYEGGADVSQTALDAGEYFPDRGLGGSGWKQDDGQEPPRPDAHHGHVAVSYTQQTLPTKRIV